MKFSGRRFAAALLLVTVATAAGAAEVAPAHAGEDAWIERLGRPESFTRMADGSLDRKTLVGGPAATIPSAGGVERSRLSHFSGAEDFHREAPAVPVLTSAFAPVPKPARRTTEGLPLAAGLTAAAGLCLYFIMSGGETAAEAEPVAVAAAPAHVPIATARIADFLLDEPAMAATAPMSAVAEQPRDERYRYVDTRMPVGTWRAIARQEQALIERWNVSADKAAGRASFEQWLDAQGPTPGVDAVLLKAKLARA